MWTIDPPLKLLRYLFDIRVNSGGVRLPACAALELTLGLGIMLSERLPSTEARAWRKFLAAWQDLAEDPSPEESPSDRRGRERRRSEQIKPMLAPLFPKLEAIPTAGWPLEALFFVYPGKQIYGQGELIRWEFKLFGESADHSRFLETILPTVEAASYTRDPRWRQPGRLWGHFDLEGVYVANGPQWQPLVQKGKLDLTLQPTATQWANHLPFSPSPNLQVKKLTWITPFALGEYAIEEKTKKRNKQTQHPIAPTMGLLFDAIAQRLETVAPGWLATQKKSRANIPPWSQARELAQKVLIIRSDLERAPLHWPGQGIGAQTFAPLPRPIIPYLTLASILHLGDYTNLGCGAFVLTA